ncbi:hypothetical protein ABFS83_14G311700 [Erythranthe nasuta]
MNEYKGSDDERRWCNNHPKELVVGICALCLNERLLLLLSSSSSTSKFTPIHKSHKHRRLTLANIFALTTLLDRLHFKHRKSDRYCCHTSSTTPGDSFISIKFEDNGVATWDKDKISKMPHHHHHHHHQQQDKKIKASSVVPDNSKPRAVLRWRKGIGQVFQLISWKRSSKGNVCHVGTKPIRRTKA